MGEAGLERRAGANAEDTVCKLGMRLSPVHRISGGLGDGWEVRDKW